MTPYEQARQLVLVMLKRIAAPTPDEIKDTVKRVCDMLRGGGELDFSEEKLVIEIETLVDVWIGTGTTWTTQRTMNPGLAIRVRKSSGIFGSDMNNFLSKKKVSRQSPSSVSAN